MSKHDPLDVLNEEMVELRSIQAAFEDNKLRADERKEKAKIMGEMLNRIESAVCVLRREERPMNVFERIVNFLFNRTPRVANERGTTSERRNVSNVNAVQQSAEQTMSFPHAEVQTPKQPIQFLNAVQTETTQKFCSLLKAFDIDGHLVILRKGDVVNANIPLVILCPYSSRLKPDVDLALEGIHVPSMSVVIIIHTVSERNLPSLTSAEKLSCYSEYNNITFIDMGFEQDRGIYKCDQNRKAFQQLTTFVEDFYQRTK